MKKRNLKFLIIITIITVLVTGCGKKSVIKNGKKTAVAINKTEISATDYYNEIKKENISKLVDMIDHQIFDNKYKSDEKENKEVEEQIKRIKSNYGKDEETYLNVIKQYFGADSEDELEKMLRLEYKRNKAVEEYVRNSIKDDEIKKYYDENISGDIKASHILIKASTKDNASSEEKEAAEKVSKEKAEKIIKKLNKGEKFSSLAKKHSDDSATKNDGGDLGYFSSKDMDDNFMEAVKKLKNNEYTKEPVKTQFGYHIILKVNEKKKPSLKSVKSKIISTLTEEKLSNDPTLHYNTLIEIREKNNIKWNDSDLKKAYNELMENLIETTKAKANNTNTN